MEGASPAGTQWQIEKEVLLLVEGRDEENFFPALLLQSLHRGDVQVKAINGKDQLRPFLGALRNDPGFESLRSLAIVRDADSDARRELQSVFNSLRACELPVPAAHAQVTSSGNPRVGVFIMPDGVRPGMLETLCLDAVADTPAMGCVEEMFDCLTRKRCPKPKNTDKARVHAYLSTCADPYRMPGLAAVEGCWPWDSEHFGPLKAFLESL